jgi:uncharacterized repeat protein (TIGR01451 family)
MNKQWKEARRDSLMWSTPVLALALAAPLWAQQPGASRPAVVRTESAYPTGDRASSMLLLERYTPGEVRIRDEFRYEVRLTNLTRATIENITLTERLPSGFRAASISPEPGRRDGDSATWEIVSLAPGGSANITVVGNTDQPAELAGCMSITLNSSLCSTTRVVEPQLRLTKTAPPEVILCDEIPLRFVVTNTGSGLARNVRIADTLPEGLTTQDGRNGLGFDAGDLGAGQSREFTASIRAARPGQYTNTARAQEEGGLTAEASAGIRVLQPVLAVSKRSPGMRFIGRPATFEITVQNTGNAPARDTMLVDDVPPGLEFLSADNNGQFRDGRATWSLGTIPPGDSRTVSITLSPSVARTYNNSATATAYCAEGTAAAELEVKGVPAILLEVVDLDDPVEVGNQTTYEITVVNQGSAVGTNIGITCTLPPEMQYITSGGPAEGRADGNTIQFAPLPTLAPKASATFRVTVRGAAAGDVRFKVSMTSDQITAPVEETESTNIY